jgi:hypothetical protein
MGCCPAPSRPCATGQDDSRKLECQNLPDRPKSLFPGNPTRRHRSACLPSGCAGTHAQDRSRRGIRPIPSSCLQCRQRLRNAREGNVPGAMHSGRRVTFYRVNPRAPKAKRRRFMVKPGCCRARPASPSLLSRANPLSRVRVHTLRVVLEIDKTVAVVQLHLKDPQHFKPQQTGNLRSGVAA